MCVLLVYVPVALPVLEAVVPATVAVHPLPLMLALIPVMLPWVTPPLKLLAFSFHGWADDADVVAVKCSPPGPVQLVNVTDVMLPMPVPDSPLPFFRVALVADDAHVRTVPVFVSFSVVLPALPVTAPPGLTVQVVAVTAMAVVAPMPIASAATPPLSRTLVRCLRM